MGVRGTSNRVRAMTNKDKNWAIEEIEDVLIALDSGFEDVLYTVREFPNIKQELLQTVDLI